ncbi:DsbA family protein [Chelativorans intermedius]|uniref:DsbA family protein n=1 Tax=Chelativorans intermedius TaxID=515947 RepID=A0ABV6DBD6_9HYPH|nr:DsbA family protein [Chelativorans intermedius]MCT9000273.1 DsbA family protein [Chelativorans intermedius]
MSKPSSGIAATILSAFAVLVAVLALLVATGTLDVGRSVPRDFEAQARQYLLDNPEVVVEALQRLEERRQQAEANELQTLIVERHDEIFNDSTAPVAGNPDGDVVLVEFFDYNCPYCRKATSDIRQAIEDDPNLKLVFKEWPILGPGSEFAARAALASLKQGKYDAFHHALMGFPGRIGENSTLTIAGDVGLDVEQLKRDMQDPAIAAAIERNRALADDLRITGTPTFVVGDEIIRGLVDLATLKRFIADARQNPEG